MKLTQTSFPASQYIAEEHPKKQIYIHHTAGNANPFNVFTGWASNQERIATCVTVGGKPKTGANWIDGEVAQGFSSKLWAYHLGLKESTFDKFNVSYRSLDKNSIGIEICNWGQLTLKNNKFYSYVNKIIPSDEVCELETPHRGFKYYHNYTDAQIEAVRDLLLLWKQKYNIPLTYYQDIWNVTPRALKGDAGVFTHNSVRFDKVDVYPHPKLIAMLKSLS
jgi:hypothetical protein